MPVTNYVWDPVDDNVVLETDNTNATTATYTHETGRYGGLISQRRGSTDSYYHYDGLGSTRELTNDSETVTDTNLYDAWGVNVDSSGTTENPYRWVGRSGYYYDAETGDYYVRARVYQPTIGRWWSVDPLGFLAFSNHYRYGTNNPAIYGDPSGLYTLYEAQSKYVSEICDHFRDRAKRKSCYSAAYEVFRTDRDSGELRFKVWFELEKKDLTKTPNWTEDLPKCPCMICKSGFLWKEWRSPDPSKWDTPHAPYDGPKYHPGADLEIRTINANKHGAGNQCTYKIVPGIKTIPYLGVANMVCHDTGRLIQRGYGAGTADRVQASDYVGSFFNLIVDANHIGHDVSPFDLAYELDDNGHKEHVKQYILVRPHINEKCDDPPPGGNATAAICECGNIIS